MHTSVQKNGGSEQRFLQLPKQKEKGNSKNGIKLLKSFEIIMENETGFPNLSKNRVYQVIKLFTLLKT